MDQYWCHLALNGEWRAYFCLCFWMLLFFFCKKFLFKVKNLNTTTAAAPRLIVGTFAAASNVTGVLTDVDLVTALLHRYNALAIFDYATAGPYVPMLVV